jgi:hypothetical protein
VQSRRRSATTRTRTIRCTGEVERGPRYAMAEERRARDCGGRALLALGRCLSASSRQTWRLLQSRCGASTGVMMKIPCKHPEKGPMMYEARPSLGRAARQRRFCCDGSQRRGRNARDITAPRPSGPSAAVVCSAWRLLGGASTAQRSCSALRGDSPDATGCPAAPQLMEYCAELTRQARQSLCLRHQRG